MKWLFAVVVALGLLIVGVYGVMRVESGTTTDAAGDTVLHFGALDIPVASDEPSLGDPLVYEGVMAHPEPQFHLEPLGPDLTFVMRERTHSVLVEMDEGRDVFGMFGRAVYVGHDVHSDPVYVFQQTGPSVADILKGLFSDWEATGIYGSSYDCCRSQGAAGTAPVRNQPIGGSLDIEGQTFTTAEMWGIDEEVAVIAFTDSEGTPLGWQRPVSGYVGAKFESEGRSDPGGANRRRSGGLEQIWRIAYDAEGNVVEEASWPASPQP